MKLIARWGRIGKFGVRGHNNMTFEKSVDNPNSMLSRVLDFLSENGPATKREILIHLDKRFKTYKPERLRGQYSEFFRLAHGAGFIEGERQGNQYIWDLGETAIKQMNL